MSIEVVENKESKTIKPIPLRPKKSSSRSKMLSNIELFCWHCQSVLKLSQSEGGIPVACEDCGEYMITPRDRLATNIVIGDFVIKQRLGAGGAGTVFLAYQRSLDRLCALKVLHDSVDSSNELLKEARVAAKLNHPNIIQCYAVTTAGPHTYYAMEYVAGRSLKEVLEKNWKLPPVKALNIMIQACEALNHAWKESRLVHRDIKPDNIMITEDGDAKVADFGLARLTGETHQTENNVFKGTPKYVCPEMIRQEAVDFRGDMYSLGVVLYKMLTGNIPFNSADRLKLLKMHLETIPVTPSTHSPDLPLELDSIILRLLEKTADKRYSSYDTLLQELIQVRQDISTLSTGNTTVLMERQHPSSLKKSTNLSRTQSLSSANQKDAVLKVQSSSIPLKKLIAAVVTIAILAGASFTFYGNKNVPEKITTDFSKLAITSVLPDPTGYDLGKEFFTIHNYSENDIDLSGLYVVDNSMNKMSLSGIVKANSSRKITLLPNYIMLDNMGDQLQLFTPDNKLITKVFFTENMIEQGTPVHF